MSNDQHVLAEGQGGSQGLHRELGFFSVFAVGFAVLSPFVGLFSVLAVGPTVAGPAWVWAVPIVLVGQLLVALVYAQLSSQFPVAGSIYRWTGRFAGPTYSWFAGWCYLCSIIAGGTTVAYFGGMWLAALVGRMPGPNELLLWSLGLIVISWAINAAGIDPLKWVLSFGVAAEAIISVVLGVVLLFFFREHSFSLLFDTLGAEAAFNGSTLGAMVAAIAVGGWLFIGFDASATVAEEARDPRRMVPRALLLIVTVLGAIITVNAFAITLAYPDPSELVTGAVLDPVTPTVIDALGSWSDKPFTFIVLIVFLNSALGGLAWGGRIMFAMARDRVLPGARSLSKVNKRGAPWVAVTVVAVLSACGLLLSLNSVAIGTLIAFGTGGFYIVFFMVIAASLVARRNGRWNPALGKFRLGRAGTVLHVIALAWIAFEAINVCWPRVQLAPPGAPWPQVWAVPLVVGALALVGLIYVLWSRPQQRVRDAVAEEES